jgi:hypothetical protein
MNELESISTWSHESAESSRSRKEKISYNRHDFANVLQKYPKEVFNYMDDFVIATQKLPEGLKRH